MIEPAETLRRLAANDESCLNAALSPAAGSRTSLDLGTRALVRLSALIAVDANTTTLRWAVELASAAGVGDAAVVQVLLDVASPAGPIQPVLSAPRVALALDLDPDGEREP